MGTAPDMPTRTWACHPGRVISDRRGIVRSLDRCPSRLSPPPAILPSLRAAGGGTLIRLIVAQVAAGERDEDVLQADVPGGEAGQRTIQPCQRVEQGRDGAMGL